MTPSEFGEWYAGHLAAFSHVAEWVNSMPEDSDRPNKPSQQAVIDSWSRILLDVDLKEAKRATDAMARGDLKEPKAFSQHAREIRNWCRATRAKKERKAWPYPAQFIHGQEVFRCPLCEDQGTVTIYSENDLLGVYGGWIGPHRGADAPRRTPAAIGKRLFYDCIRTSAVRCTCEAGIDNPAARALPLLFDGKSMIPATTCDHERQYAEIVEFCEPKDGLRERIGRILHQIDPEAA